MGIAKGIPAFVALVGRPVVMHKHADERRQQAEGVQGLGAAFGMGKIAGISPAWLVRFRPPVSERIFGEDRRALFGFFLVFLLMERVTPQADLIRF